MAWAMAAVTTATEEDQADMAVRAAVVSVSAAAAAATIHGHMVSVEEQTFSLIRIQVKRSEFRVQSHNEHINRVAHFYLDS